MRPLKVAIQGIAASYHHEAARQYLKEDFEIIECNTFKNVCEHLASNSIDYAILAIENSIAGSILSNYSLIREYNFSIIGEIYLRINFHLLANKGVALQDLRYIESHPMALAQCTEFLSMQEHVSVVESHDTASCAKQIATTQLTDTAAIASLGAAKQYGLEVLVPDIADNKLNYTRFLVIAKHHIHVEQPNKSTICFELPDKKGALADVLNLVKDQEINLAKIQSVPILGKPLQYSFYVDLEWDNPLQYEDAVDAVKKTTHNFSILGKYKKDHLNMH